MEDLVQLRIDSGDTEMKRLTESKKNATYTSPRIQNELIEMCGDTVCNLILKDVKKAFAYYVLADETADISGKEQLSIGVRFFDEEKMVVREEFLGFTDLEAMDAITIANAIDSFLEKNGLDPRKCEGQRYDGCSAMAGNDGGVQKILREKYKKALYFHCASHRLNLVVNDLNAVPQIRNALSTLKDIIRFFRESPLRRKTIPHIPSFCETRWSEKYRCVSIFMNNFVEIVQALDKLAQEANVATRKAAFQLHCSATTPVFIISTCIIAKYSAFLEPVVNVLQGKTMDVFQCSGHIKKIVSTVKAHRLSPDSEMKAIYTSAEIIAQQLQVTLSLPRVTERQVHRSNPPANSLEEYCKRSILIPYLDYFCSALEHRFSEGNTPAFTSLSLHPFHMLRSTVEEVKKKAKIIAEFYELDMSGLDAEVELWYNVWKEKKYDSEKVKDLDLVDVIKEAITFFPTIKNALFISIALPCTTCTIERSFSTLRRVKTWLRSTMTETRLNGLCRMSVHRKLLSDQKKEIEEEVVEKFAENPRRLML